MIAPLVVGALLLLAMWFVLFRSSPPGPPYVEVGPAAGFPDGEARRVAEGVFLGRSGDELFAVAEPDGCPLSIDPEPYVDCEGERYAIDGEALEGGRGLDRLPVALHDGTVYIDPEHPVESG